MSDMKEEPLAEETAAKGKGKAVDTTPSHDMTMEEDDDSEEESGIEEAVRSTFFQFHRGTY